VDIEKIREICSLSPSLKGLSRVDILELVDRVITAEVSRDALLAEREQLLAQEPESIQYRYLDHRTKEFSKWGDKILGRTGGFETRNLYTQAIPARKVDRQTVIDVLLSVGNMSEGVIADAIIGAIRSQQVIRVPEHKWNFPTLGALRNTIQDSAILQPSTAVAVTAEEANFCALKSIKDSEVAKVARAFWRRIYTYRNDFGIELPHPLPVEFMAHMATALTWVDREPSPRITEQDSPAYDLDKMSWDAIKLAANESGWIPQEYCMNDWVSDVCSFLRRCRSDRVAEQNAIKSLPYWEPCNPACDPELGQGRDRLCKCKPALGALNKLNAKPETCELCESLDPWQQAEGTRCPEHTKPESVGG